MEAIATPAQQAIGRICKAILKSSANQFFYVKFVKKDHTIREMQARLHVKKDRVHGGKVKPTTAHIEKYLTVFDVVHEKKRQKAMKEAADIITTSPLSEERTQAFITYKQWLKQKSFRNINCETIISMTVKGIRHEITDENTMYIKGSENFNKPDIIVGKGNSL